MLLKNEVLTLTRQLRIEEAIKTLEEFATNEPIMESWKLLEEATQKLTDMKELDIASKLWSSGSNRLAKRVGAPPTYFCEKKSQDIPTKEINFFSDLLKEKNQNSDQPKRYLLSIIDENDDVNNGFDSLDGLLALEKEKLFEQGNFKVPIWKYMRSYEILLIPRIIMVGLSTPSSLTGYTPMSLDGYWIKNFTQGGTGGRVIRYQAAQIKISEYVHERGSVFVIPGDHMNKFFHAMCNTFPALQIYRQLNLDCPIVFPKFPVEEQPKLSEIQSTLLKVMNIPEERVISQTNLENTYFNNGLLPQAFAPDRRVVEFYRKTASELDLNRESGLSNKYIYISRGDAKRRPIINQKEIISVLEAMGFSSVEMTYRSFEEQISIVRDASIIVAPHGAGLTNMVFCKPGTKIVELITESKRNIFYRLANLCEHKYYPILCSQASRSSRFETTSGNDCWHLDVTKLRKVIEKITN
ncbi:hypothetical protein PCC7418_3293 [Halothece sp. PCC 7418]|uniref:glycosyltransferase family 61 protein n=1 Tax=Halothece sp. (strain PCC 7418) TaxID=65093 RepID=UPI0002A0794B|nr:glycosyltransferase family 61 protein [Halothece sp. PCC 7418]AFZ45408.1 hypothetical protein PCC7418_3293 [Halothece sp. PCC 7418]